jgi:hypothetical protein
VVTLADDRPSVRQSIATGRAGERITGRGLTDLSATLSFSADGIRFIQLPVRFRLGGEGYFAFAQAPGSVPPDLSGFSQVVLRAVFRRPGVAPDVVDVTVRGDDLALEDVEHDLHGQTIRFRRIAAAPFDMSLAVDPAHVALAGIVLRDHDPTSPVADVTVTVSDGPAPIVTDASGRFFVPQLPLLPDVEIELADGPATTSVPYHIDYQAPVNHVSLSLPD